MRFTKRKRAFALAVASSILAIQIGVSSYAFASAEGQPSSPAPARIQNPDADPELRDLKEFYRAELKNIQNSKSSNWTSALTLLGALFAAMVALVSLYVNTKTAARNQRDTQFYEAAKRLGDKDNPSVRFSAAGILAKMAKDEIPKKWTRTTSRRARRRGQTYFEAALDQLVASLLVEHNSGCLSAISDALQSLIDDDAKGVLQKVHKANLELQSDFASALAESMATQQDEGSFPFRGGNHWTLTAASTPYEEMVLSSFAIRFMDQIEKDYRTVKHELKMDPSKKTRRAVAAQRALRPAANRLRSTVEVYSAALRANPFADLQKNFDQLPDLLTQPHPMNFGRAFLVNANLEDAQLQGFNLEGVQLQQANLFRTQFQKANMSAASFQGANLFAANFLKAFLVASKFSPFELRTADGAAYYHRPTNLDGADLRQAELNAANFEQAILDGADLTEAQLSDAILRNTSIDTETVFTGVEWWKANFFLTDEPNPEKIDLELINRIYAKHDQTIEIDLSEAHPSVLGFLDVQQPKTASQPASETAPIQSSDPGD
jgi:uncharacterized protein YjbI with pentapeptide repeats